MKALAERGDVKIDGWAWDEVYEKGPDGKDVLVERTRVVHNLQVDNSIILVAGLLAGDLGFTGGITWHAQGSGSPSWDPGMGPAPSPTDTQLVSEQGRKQPDFIIYCTVTAGVSPGSAPTLPPGAGSTLFVAFDGGTVQTVTFAGTENTTALVEAAINGQVTGGTASINPISHDIDISSNTVGPQSEVVISGGSALTAIGQTAGTYYGTLTPLGVGMRGTTIQVQTTYDYGDLIGVTIREQGLFGGNATSALNSGYMFNEIRQVARYKSGAVKLVRSIILQLSI